MHCRHIHSCIAFASSGRRWRRNCIFQHQTENMKYDPQIVNISKIFDLLLIMCAEANNFYICYSFCVSSTSSPCFRWSVRGSRCLSLSLSLTHTFVPKSLWDSMCILAEFTVAVAASASDESIYTRQITMRNDCDMWYSRATTIAIASFVWNLFGFYHFYYRRYSGENKTSIISSRVLLCSIFMFIFIVRRCDSLSRPLHIV